MKYIKLKILPKYFLLLLLIILIFIVYISAESNIIIITIKGKGNQHILNNKTIDNFYFNNTPSTILVNGITQNYTGFIVYNLTKQQNIITIKWNYTFINCNLMFYNLSNITKIDLSQFNSSKVINMNYMFYNCTSLSSLNLNNFNTSLVTHMNYMFYIVLHYYF